MRRDVTKASAAASRTAASPPKSRSEKKMKVSETEICPRTRGISTETREPKASVTMLMRRKRRPRAEGWSRVMLYAHATAPSEMTAHIYGCEMRCLVAELNIGYVFRTDGGICERAGGLHGGRAAARGRRA